VPSSSRKKPKKTLFQRGIWGGPPHFFQAAWGPAVFTPSVFRGKGFPGQNGLSGLFLTRNKKKKRGAKTPRGRGAKFYFGVLAGASGVCADIFCVRGGPHPRLGFLFGGRCLFPGLGKCFFEITKKDHRGNKKKSSGEGRSVVFCRFFWGGATGPHRKEKKKKSGVLGAGRSAGREKGGGGGDLGGLGVKKDPVPEINCRAGEKKRGGGTALGPRGGHFFGIRGARNFRGFNNQGPGGPKILADRLPGAPGEQKSLFTREPLLRPPLAGVPQGTGGGPWPNRDGEGTKHGPRVCVTDGGRAPGGKKNEGGSLGRGGRVFLCPGGGRALEGEFFSTNPLRLDPFFCGGAGISDVNGARPHFLNLSLTFSTQTLKAVFFRGGPFLFPTIGPVKNSFSN